jgi:uncharacterized protein YukE
MKVNRVAKCRKDQKPCGKCGTELPKGSAYRWWQFFRSKFKHVRCMDPKCSPRASDLCQSKFSGVYMGQENAQDALDAWEKEVREVDLNSECETPSYEDLKNDLENAAGEIREIGEEYRESASNIEDNFPGSEQAQNMEECADGLEEYADGLENALDSINEAPETGDDDKITEDTLSDWISEVRSAVEDAIGGDLPDQPGYGG